MKVWDCSITFCISDHSVMHRRGSKYNNVRATILEYCTAFISFTNNIISIYKFYYLIISLQLFFLVDKQFACFVSLLNLINFKKMHAEKCSFFNAYRKTEICLTL